MRGRFSTAVAAVVTIGMLSGPARAEASLNEILRDYDNAKAGEPQRAMIASNLAGIELGLGWANSALRAQRMQAALYCPPDRSAMTGSQVIDILRRALKEEPRLGDRPIGFAVLAALQRAFPCK